MLHRERSVTLRDVLSDILSPIIRKDHSQFLKKKFRNIKITNFSNHPRDPQPFPRSSKKISTLQRSLVRVSTKCRATSRENRKREREQSEIARKWASYESKSVSSKTHVSQVANDVFTSSWHCLGFRDPRFR